MWKRASELLIEHGERSDCFGPADPAGIQDVRQVLYSIFGNDGADELMKKMRDKEMERLPKTWTGWLYNRFLGYDQLGKH